MFSRSTTASININSSGWESVRLAVTWDAPLARSLRFRRPSRGIGVGIAANLAASFAVIEIWRSFPLLHIQAFILLAQNYYALG